MESTTISSSSEPSTISEIVQKAEQAENGRAAMFVDGKMRWITEAGTPGDLVSNGNFYYTQLDDGTYRLFDKDSRNERTAQFSKSPSARFDRFS
jgi:outer membrane lipoprotein-sorting protein